MKKQTTHYEIDIYLVIVVEWLISIGYTWGSRWTFKNCRGIVFSIPIVHSKHWSSHIEYYLKNRNVPAHFDQWHLKNSTDSKKIGDKIKALQISEWAVQTACL